MRGVMRAVCLLMCDGLLDESRPDARERLVFSTMTTLRVTADGTGAIQPPLHASRETCRVPHQASVVGPALCVVLIRPYREAGSPMLRYVRPDVHPTLLLTAGFRSATTASFLSSSPHRVSVPFEDPGQVAVLRSLRRCCVGNDSTAVFAVILDCFSPVVVCPSLCLSLSLCLPFSLYLSRIRECSPCRS